MTRGSQARIRRWNRRANIHLSGTLGHFPLGLQGETIDVIKTRRRVSWICLHRNKSDFGINDIVASDTTVMDFENRR
jgi:hypothetical protein